MFNLVDFITPDNLQAEQDKFLQSENYDPIFHYSWHDYMPTNLPTNGLKQQLVDAILNHDNTQITHIAQSLFEVTFDQNTLDQATSVASQQGLVSSGNAQAYAAALTEGLHYFSLDDIEVVISNEKGFNSRPRHQQKQIIVSKDIHFGFFSIEGGVRHELVHVLRYRNGKHNNISQSARYLPTEEGLASWCQDHANDDNGQAQHAMEYIGSYVGQNGSLRDIYNTMLSFGMSKELAWKRASRHKYGFVDTRLPGDIMKPAMYYANEIKVDNLTTQDKLRLFVGKINIDELNLYNKYSGIWPEQQLVEYFHL